MTVLAWVAPAIPARAQPGPALPWLHVEHPGDGLAQIVDGAGRTVVLRGANASGFEDDWYRDRNPDGSQKTAQFWPIDPASYANGRCPANSHVIAQPALCEHDFAQMRALGFNVVRLTLSWSALEPERGRYDTKYLDRIEQVVRWAAAAGVYVLLDMHQDNYSRFIPPHSPIEVPPVLTSSPGSGNHAGGAPAWAILTDGEPSASALGVDFFNAQMEAAFTSFWLNRDGLQDHYVGAIAAVARRVKNNPAVIGYEIMNEPLPGYIPEPLFSALFLYPFYGHVIDRVGDRRHLFFFEPMAARNLVDASAQLSLPFTTSLNIVYAPHVYTHVFTAETVVPGASALPFPISYDQAFQTAELEARAMGAALFIGEYGNGATNDDTQLAPETAALDRNRSGATIWSWKANCDPGTGPGGCPGSWGTFFGDSAQPPANSLAIKPTRQKYLARIYPRATAGRLVSFEYTPANGAFAMVATSSARVRRGATGKETIVYIPPNVGGAARVTGAAVLDREIKQGDGSRLVLVAPTGRGMYAVNVTPSGGH